LPRQQEEEHKVKIKSPKDFWAGLMFVGFGLFFAVWAVANYQMGTAVRMGPAYFPALLGGLLAVLGAVVLAGSLAIRGPNVPQFHFRPLALIVVACVAFGYLVKPLGLVLSILVLVVLSALGGHEFRWKEVIILFAALAIFSVLVFVKGLGLPFQLWPAMFD
jgi:Tripartite tricarboxylate transporter TctB family